MMKIDKTLQSSISIALFAIGMVLVGCQKDTTPEDTSQEHVERVEMSAAPAAAEVPVIFADDLDEADSQIVEEVITGEQPEEGVVKVPYEGEAMDTMDSDLLSIDEELEPEPEVDISDKTVLPLAQTEDR